MKRTGVAKLPLHYGRAPHWLVSRMVKLAGHIVTVIVDEYGHEEFLQKISDPFWFQALGCVLGYDWHSSGVTTVLTGVLKRAIKTEEYELAVCGGKGKASRQTPQEISQAGESFGFSIEDINRLKYASRMSAKVDNTAIQAGYSLYHHAFFMTKNGKWAVIQQGMDERDRTARRYHWLSDNVENFVVVPHDAVVGDVKREVALDMTAKESMECQKTSTDIAKEKPKKVVRMLQSIRPTSQKSLQEWMPTIKKKGYVIDVLSLPRRLNWKAMKRTYDFQPKNYEQLLGIRGIGPSTVRGLALISELIYGDPPSWKDPVRYSFAYGGKDGVPYPVNREAMDKSIQILKNAIENAKIGNKDKLKSLVRLKQFAQLQPQKPKFR
ncbi:MAG: DUF763 domain-containing protein [Candidatus Bathyarchaeota archaeon]|nr:DUF763 domain-containing protein [Candidatus Bathyarchaeota archaeon]MDH5733714.1 DUF763 domain-containing protein [Candidatus Bathyarchaeota archaeon]